MVEDMEGDNGHDGRAGAFAMMTTTTRDCTHRWHARSLTHTRADLMFKINATEGNKVPKGVD
ncbi:hypothetical protein OUZ56_008378 [Daphnia magna]|uniref:Uncharacterized protein n=1 Tax=Daphnia magna TaxID=35525 RepID=A0ABR0ACS5_9CRUS|nr:hypothetical protein OUZ56_008378 [Daphnia magna]